jgi:hypothetical protein
MGHTDVSFPLRRYATTEYDFLRQQINLLHKTECRLIFESGSTFDFGHNARGAAQRVDTVLLLYHNIRKRFTSCYCNRLCYRGSAFSESGTVAGKSAFPAAASNLTPSVRVCSGQHGKF